MNQIKIFGGREDASKNSRLAFAYQKNSLSNWGRWIFVVTISIELREGIIIIRCEVHWLV